MRWSPLVFVGLVVLASIVAGCGGDDGGPASTPLAGGDAARDADAAARDATGAPDAIAESIADASGDEQVTQEDGGTDADRDVEMDAGREANVEASPEAAVDASVSPEGGMDATSDAPIDAVAETSADAAEPVLVAIAVTPQSPLVFPRMSIALTANGVYYDPSTGDSPVRDITRLVTWSSSRPASVFVSNTPGFQGRVTAIDSVTTIITATLGSVSGMTTLPAGSPSLVEISISPTRPYVPVGVPFHFYATGLWSTGDRQDFTSGVTWSTSDPTIAAFEGPAGFIVGKQTGSTATVTAKIANLTATTDIFVIHKTIAVLAVAPNPLVMAKDTEQQLVATAMFTDATTEDLTEFVSWTSSDEAVALFAQPFRKGLVAGFGVGSATVTASFGASSGTLSVGVSSATLVSIEVTPDHPSYPMFVAHPLRAIGHFSDGSTQDLSLVASWKSSDEEITSGRKLGSTTVTATYLGVSGSTAVTVFEAILDSIAITPASPTVALGHQQAFRADATYLDANAVPFHLDLTTQAGWFSSNETVAPIGNAPGTYGVATSLTTGTTTISGAFTGVGGTATLTVASSSRR